MAGVLYALLVGSAALAMWVREVPGVLPPSLEVAAPWVFLAFLLCFAIYRLVLVRARKYPAFKAFFQIGAAALFFLLLLPSAKKAYRIEEDPLAILMQDTSPNVRAVAAEVARHRPSPQQYGPHLARALEDPDPEVREQAHRSLVAVTGEDLGSPKDPEAIRAWKERYP